ncbi:kinase-like domain-containing protein [Rhizophagus irregularis DAOM 181602=DAOM 197198]|nr:kinase-like domain-containing protein [Rhizophagus irregularis DAOM 181602=DAOM 197198]
MSGNIIIIDCVNLFSMIMWEFTSGHPPFNYEEHDQNLVLDICEGKRPGIIKNTPKCYIDLMKKCWDSNPSNRPTIMMLENVISEWIRCMNEYYRLNSDGNHRYEVPNIYDQLKNDLMEFVKANRALIQEQVNTSIIYSHPQAYYASRKLTEILNQKSFEYITEISDQEKTQCYECIIEN